MKEEPYQLCLAINYGSAVIKTEKKLNEKSIIIGIKLKS